jgi:hypothetical protein
MKLKGKPSRRKTLEEEEKKMGSS